MTVPSTLQEKKGALVGDSLRQRNHINVAWGGFTVDATPKEIFIDGDLTSDSRLILTTGTVLIAQGFFAAYNVTDNVLLASGRFALSTTNIANTVAASGLTLEWDAASVDANPFIQYFVGSAGLVFAYNNTTKSITLTVTGVAAKRIIWRASITDYLSFAV
jgi:hypothetical protein